MKAQLKVALQMIRGSLFVAAVAALLVWPAPVRSDFPPEKAENLQVLPQDMETRALLDTMKGVSKALGVRCTHCHEGEEGQDLSTFDFVTDDRVEKRIAREMLRMTMAINGENMSKIGALAKERDAEHADPHVTCFTCHRGQASPE